MDPLSALGVAAAAVGFFDCAVGLIKMYRQIRDRGDPDLLRTIRTTASDLAAARKSLIQRPSNPALSLEVSENEQALDELFEQCDKIVNRLLEMLQSLEEKARDFGQLDKPTRLKAFSRAVKTFWEADELEGLDAQLVKFRGQLAFRLLTVLNAKLDYSSRQQTGRFDRLDKKGDEIVDVLAIHHQSLAKKLAEHSRDVASTNRGLIEAILTLRDGSTTSVVLDSSERNYTNTAALTDTLRSNNVVSIRSPRDMHPAELGIGSLDNVTSRVLSCLNFRQMRDRFESIPEAHAQTLQWIFDAPETGAKWDNFFAWLESGTGCYWINGKAGSGKSTLMKFLWAHQDRSAYLAKWAKGRPLIMASFFFWYLGSSLQKSQAGLLRSLLYDILTKTPSLIPVVMPDLCQEVTKHPDNQLGEPSIIELTRWFNNLACDVSEHQQARFCLFIDGLDEFAGDHQDLADFFVGIASKSGNIKLVVSSRPLTTFTEAFEDASSLRLQDLTEQDIRHYTDAKLRKKFSAKLGGEWTTILDEIVVKSDGVFLWVSLVVKSLLSGLRDGDTVTELRARLDELPSDLKDLYQHMLDRIPKDYRLQASEMFQTVLINLAGGRNVVGRGDEGLMPPHFTLLELAFALDKSPFPFGQPIKPIPRNRIRRMASDTEVRLRARCLGILEVRDSSRWRNMSNAPVDFIHRTAVEFLSAENVVQTLGSPVGFNPLTALFQACLWKGRTIPIVKRPKLLKFQETWRYLWQGLDIASLAEISGTPIPPDYIIEMDRLYATRWDASSIYWPTSSMSALIQKPSTWSRYLSAELNTSKRMTPIDNLRRSSQHIFDAMIHTNDSSCPSHRLACQPSTLLVGIQYALFSFCRHALAPYRIPKGDGAESTAPTLCLEYFMRAFFYRVFEEFASNPGGVTIVINICETLFEAGADPNKQMAVPPNENQRPIGNAGPFLRNKTPWTFLAAMLLGDYIGFLRTAKLRPNFALWEAVIKVFVNKGARTDAIVNAQGFLLEGPPSQLWHPRPLSNQLEVFVFRNTRSADPRLEILMDSARRIQHYLESPPETTNLNTDPRASSSKEPKEGGNLALQATQAGDVETGHSPESNACELGHEQPLDRSAWLHDTLRLLLCCNGTRRG